VSAQYFRFTPRGIGDRRRSPLLERLLARAGGPTAVADWRADAFRIIAPNSTSMPGVGAAGLFAERGLVEAASVFIATPVHYVAEMSNVRLAADGILSLSRPEADALAADFNRVWVDAGVRLLAPAGQGPGMGSTYLFCVTDQALDAVGRDPEDVLGRHIADYLPAGAAAPRLRRLMSEIEMWLFEHAVNRTRIARAAPAVSGLWLWGGGSALASLPRVEGWTVGDDPFFKAFGARAQSEFGACARSPSVADPPAGAHAAGRAGVAVIAAQPGTDAWRDAESRWLERSVADLGAGRIARLDLSAGDRCFSVGGRWNWRAWRRRRPWWEYFE
jgi:hypothetical protein